MPAATVTSKGQITVPKPIRELLKVDTGDVLEFLVDDRGQVTVRAARLDARDLRGLLRVPGRKPVPLAEMDAAIRRAVKP